MEITLCEIKSESYFLCTHLRLHLPHLTIVSVHLLSTTVIHCPLFHLKLTNTLPDCNTLWDGTVIVLTPLSMDSQ